MFQVTDTVAAGSGLVVGYAAKWSDRQARWFSQWTNSAVITGAAVGVGALGLMFMRSPTPNTEAVLEGALVGGAALLGERLAMMGTTPAAAIAAYNPAGFVSAPAVPYSPAAGRYAAGAVVNRETRSTVLG